MRGRIFSIVGLVMGCISVSISGDRIAVGALREAGNASGVNGDQNNNFSNSSGAVYVFVRNAGAWTPTGGKPLCLAICIMWPWKWNCPPAASPD